MFKPNLVSINIKQNKIIGKIVIDTFGEEIEIKNIVFIHRNSLNQKKYSFPVIINDKKISFQIDAFTVLWKPYYWDAYLEVQVNNKIEYIRIKVANYHIKFKMNGTPFIKSILFNNGFHLFPYITSYGSFSLTYKKKMYYESKVYQWKWFFALVTYILLKPYWKSKNIWLGFEKNANAAQDNGFAFFKYCHLNDKHQNFFYVIKKNSPDYSRLTPLKDKVLYFMSFKYMIYVIASKLLISSETKGHVFDIRIHRGIVQRILHYKKQVFLQHGVLGLKRIEKILQKNSSNRVDIFIASSEYEKEIILLNFGYEENEVAVTGLSRWDFLENRTTERKILIMPTWRAWMDDIAEDEFLTTDYYKTYSNLIHSAKLLKIIKKFNANVTFFLHPKLTQYSAYFESIDSRIKIQTSDSSVLSEELMNTALLITDYSSIAWDMYYMKKPVVFYQFDQEEYQKHQGSYLNLSEDLFGEQVDNIDSLIDVIISYLKNDFAEKEIYKLKRNKYFSYSDRYNNERIFSVISDNLDRLYQDNSLIKSKLTRYTTSIGSSSKDRAI